MKRQNKRLLPLILSLFLVSGCASMLSSGPAPVRLQLSPPMPESMAQRPLNRQIIVVMPIAARA